jgi:hypothetical protein
MLLARRPCWYAPCTTPSRFLSGTTIREEAFMQFRPVTLIVVVCIAASFGFAGAASRTCATADPEPRANLVVP